MHANFKTGKFINWFNRPSGPRTVHFWAPVFKWSLVLASLGDFKRPAETVSIPQSAALTATGFIWSRYSTQIIPVNYGLLSVNLFVGVSGFYQLVRAIIAQYHTK